MEEKRTDERTDGRTDERTGPGRCEKTAVFDQS